MAGFEQTIIIGNLGGDPELKYLDSGAAVCNFSVAVTRRYTDRAGEQQESTNWYRVAVWGNQAEPCNTYLRKGSQVQVVGTVEARAYAGSEGPRASLDLRAFQVVFLGSRGDDHPRRDGPANPNDIAF